jgi:hypothetical protein
VLLLDEVQEVRRVRAADEVERPHLQAAGEAVDDVHRLLRAQRFFQQLARVVDAARGDELLGHHELVELHQHLVALLGLDALQARDLEGELLDFVFPKVLEDLRGDLGPQRHQENGGLLPARERLLVRGRGLGFPL